MAKECDRGQTTAVIFVKILVEGQTEELFVDNILAQHLVQNRIVLTPIVHTTKSVDVGPNYKGGLAKYHSVKKQIQALLHDKSTTLVTTLLDFYGIPSDFPGFDTMPTGTCYERVVHLEQRLQEDIFHSKFLAHFSLHEFEAILFASPQAIASYFPSLNILSRLQKIRNDVTSPEEINEDQPPSKRLKEILPSTYRKPEDGQSITASIGLELIRQQCPHFNEWLNRLENLSG
jgi:hypothetical protein